MTRFPFVARHLFDKSNGESRQNKAPPGACFGKSAGALRAGTSVDFSVRNSVNLVFMGFLEKIKRLEYSRFLCHQKNNFLGFAHQKSHILFMKECGNKKKMCFCKKPISLETKKFIMEKSAFFREMSTLTERLL